MIQQNTQNKTKQRNYSIDTLKFLCAFLVILVHTEGPLSIDILVKVAVPIFFIISGYFMYNSDIKYMQDKLLSTLKKICVITTWSTILYATVSLVFSSSYVSIGWIAKQSVGLLLFNNPIWGFHLWYLFAYIYTLIAVFYLYKFNIIKLAFYSIPILLSISVLFGLYSFLIFDNFVLPSMVTRNFLFCGIPYFLIGILIKKFSAEIFKKKNIIYISAIVFTLFTIVEHLINPRSLGFGPGAYFITTAPLSITIFLLTLLTKQSKDNIFSKIGRNDSLYIYIFHPLTMMILDKLSSMFLTEDSIYYNYYKWLYSLLVFIITIVGCYIFRTSILPIYNKVIERVG